MANTLSQVQSVLVDISGTLQIGGELTLKANIALNQSVMSVVINVSQTLFVWFTRLVSCTYNT